MVTDRAATSRPLGRMETGLALSNQHWPMNMVAAIRLSPAPDPELLRAALDHVQRRHPALDARIDRAGRKHFFAYGNVPPISLDVIDDAGPDDVTVAIEHGLNTSVPTATGPLMATTLLRDGGAADLVVTMHHAIADATSGARMLGEVLATHAALADGRPAPDGTRLPTPAAADDLYPPGYTGARFRLRGARFAMSTMIPEMRYRKAMRRNGGPAVDQKGRSQIRSAELDADTTSALGRAARRRRITLASTLQAAALAAAHRLRYASRPVPLRTFSFPDLRPHLEPAVSAEQLACYMALTWQDVPMNGSDDLWTVAGEVQQRVEASVRGGAKFVATAMTVPTIRMVMATKKLRMGNVAVSHTGVTPLADRYGPLTVGGVRGFISNLAVGPELGLRTGILHGRLTIDAVTLDTDMDRAAMRRMVDAVVASLEAAAAS